MNFSPRMEHFIDNRLVEVGARWNRSLSLPSFQLLVICDGVNPQAFHGEVRMGGHLLMTTPSTYDWEKASRAAEQAFTNKLASLLKD